MKKESKIKLKAYSVFACANFMIFNTTHGEVIYTDIDPDTILNETEEFFALDIDNNGTFDFGFLNNSATTYDFTLGYVTFQSLLAGPFISSNALAGISHYYFYSGGNRYFPYAFSESNLIEPLLNWQNFGIQFIAWKTWAGGYDDHCDLCYWNSESLPELLDHYLGAKFVDSDNNIHYGWIRCDVKDDGHALIIKDFAYESETNQPILTGSKETYQNINSNILSGNIYASGNIVYVNISSRPELDFTLNIYDMSGRCVYQKNLHESRNSILTSLTTGIYLVEVQCGKASLSKTLLLGK